LIHTKGYMGKNYLSTKKDYVEKVTTVVVTYNPDISRLEALLDSLSLFRSVQLTDNNSDNIDEIKQLCSIYENIHPCFLPSNVGLAEAQNKAVEQIEGDVSSDDFILLLDQDSVPLDDCIEVLFQHANSLIAGGVRLGVIGPALSDSYSDSRFGFIKNGRRRYKQSSKNHTFECDGINSSGSLIPLAVWRELKGNNSELFIDHVETDWCFRVIAVGYVCYGTFDALLSHSMGESTIKYWLFGQKSMPDRTPKRHYYLFRNSMHLQKQKYVPRLWKLANIVKLLFTVCYFSLFSQQKVDHFKNMWVGLLDGFRGHLGIDNRYLK